MKKINIAFFVILFLILSINNASAFTILSESMSGGMLNTPWIPNTLTLIFNGDQTQPLYSSHGIRGSHPGDVNFANNNAFQYYSKSQNQQNAKVLWTEYYPVSFTTQFTSGFGVWCLSKSNIQKVGVFISPSQRQMFYYSGTENGLGFDFNFTAGFHNFEEDCLNGSFTLKEDDSPILIGSYSTLLQYDQFLIQTDTVAEEEISNLQYCDINGCGLPFLLVPLLKQTDINWGLQLYDSADKWSPLHSTIAEWGCALTSATMILQYYHIDKLPDGTTLDPGTLNTWLKNQKDGYISNGLINWLAISRLTKQSKVQNPTFTFDALEYRRSGKNDALLTQDLTNNQPDILEEPGHFIVGTGQTSNSFSINDPFYTSTDLTQGYNNTYLSLGRYIPSHTDLSYIMLVTDPSVTISLTDTNNVSTGSSYLQNPLTGDQDPGLTSGNPINIFYAPQPHTGTYFLTLTGQPNQPYTATGYLYDINGNATDPIILKGNFDSNGKSSNIVTFDNQSVNNDTIKSAATFETLLHDIDHLKDTNQIQKGPADALAALAKNASKSTDKKNTLPVKVQLIALQGLLDVFHNRGVSDQAYNTLTFEVQYLLNSL